MNKKRPASPPVQIRNGRKIDPYPLLAPGSHIQIEIRYRTRGFGTSQYSAAFKADVCTQGPYPVQDIGAGPPEHLLRGVAKEIFCCVVPETDFARLPNGKNRIRCVFEKGEQLRFQHVHILERLTETRRNNESEPEAASIFFPSTMIVTSAIDSCRHCSNIRMDVMHVHQLCFWPCNGKQKRAVFQRFNIVFKTALKSEEVSGAKFLHPLVGKVYPDLP